MKNTAMNEHNFKVRDRRNRGWFYLDNEYLNGYAKIFGPIGTAVYLSLCRRADKKQSCWPSEIKIAADHGMTDRTVRKYIKIFAGANLIRTERERTKSGKWPHNVYYLIDKSEWNKPEEIVSAGYQRKIKTQPEENNDQNQRNQVPFKDAQEKETHKKDNGPDKTFNENKAISVEGFVPSNAEESRCLEIAKELEEKNMNCILAYKQRYGMEIIEKARGILRERPARRPLRNKRAYFNGIVKKLVEEKTKNHDES